MQSLSARGLEARRGRGLRAWAGSPKEAQRRSRNGCGGVWAIFLVPDAFLRRSPNSFLVVRSCRACNGGLRQCLGGGRGRFWAGAAGPRRLRVDIFSTGFFGQAHGLQHRAIALSQVDSFKMLVGTRQVQRLVFGCVTGAQAKHWRRSAPAARPRVGTPESELRRRLYLSGGPLRAGPAP